MSLVQQWIAGKEKMDRDLVERELTLEYSKVVLPMLGVNSDPKEVFHQAHKYAEAFMEWLELEREVARLMGPEAD